MVALPILFAGSWTSGTGDLDAKYQLTGRGMGPRSRTYPVLCRCRWSTTGPQVVSNGGMWCSHDPHENALSVPSHPAVCLSITSIVSFGWFASSVLPFFLAVSYFMVTPPHVCVTRLYPLL
ncbi:hypothetical protein GJAV_G00064710 [Gymnothorax javanicus]|nr:hypothetical protein GJAV_G00064710 [Gymnothorax javanicus]